MKAGRPFKHTGKRLENLNNLIRTKYPQDEWVLEPILPLFLSIIDSSSTIEQQEQVIDLLNKVFNDYEFRYNTILENTIIMSDEFKRMQKLANLPITENKVEETKETINENFVGMGMVGNIFDREKTDYELAFEHFTKGTSLNEVEEENELEEANPLEGGPDDMTKYRIGVLTKLISDLENDETFDQSSEVLQGLKDSREALKAQLTDK